MNAPRSADVLGDRCAPFIVHAAGAADFGVEMDARVDLGRACAGNLYLGVFGFQVETVRVAGACQVKIRGFGLALEVDIAAAGDFGRDLGCIDLHFHIAGAADVHGEVLRVVDECLADDIAGARDVDIVVNRRGDIDLEVAGGVEVKAALFTDDDLIAFLKDFHELLEVLIHLYLDGMLVALGNKNLCRTAHLNILKIIDRPVLSGDISISMDPFAEEIAAGKQEHGKGKQQQRSLQVKRGHGASFRLSANVTDLTGKRRGGYTGGFFLPSLHDDGKDSNPRLWFSVYSIDSQGCTRG